MKKWRILLVVGAGVIPALLIGCTHNHDHHRRGRGHTSLVIVDEAPPPNRVEIRRASPGRDYVWIEGNWDRRGRDWHWCEGRWERRPHSRAQWVPGQWSRGDRGYVRVEGYWR